MAGLLDESGVWIRKGAMTGAVPVRLRCHEQHVFSCMYARIAQKTAPVLDSLRRGTNIP